MAAFLANVGVNSSHRARSPLYSDGTFKLRPIPESRPWAPPMRRLPDVWGDRAVHLDPDLEGDPPTYGDNCRRAGRAFSLRRARSGDVIVFVARLEPAEKAPSLDTSGRAEARFHLVGALTIAEVKSDVTDEPGPGWWDGNAHVLRARAGGLWDSFWVFRGRPPTGLFDLALPFGRQEAALLFGPDWGWPSHRSELQVIGSHTRAVRRLTGLAERRLLRMLP